MNPIRQAIYRRNASSSIVKDLQKELNDYLGVIVLSAKRRYTADVSERAEDVFVRTNMGSLDDHFPGLLEIIEGYKHRELKVNDYNQYTVITMVGANDNA